MNQARVTLQATDAYQVLSAAPSLTADEVSISDSVGAAQAHLDGVQSLSLQHRLVPASHW